MLPVSDRMCGESSIIAGIGCGCHCTCIDKNPPFVVASMGLSNVCTDDVCWRGGNIFSECIPVFSICMSSHT